MPNVRIPMGVLFLVAFVAPLSIVFGFSFFPERTFGFTGELTLENYEHFFTEGYYGTFLWTFGLAFAATCCCLVIGYPVAYGLARVFGGWAAIITLDLRLPHLRFREPAPGRLDAGSAEGRRRVWPTR